MTKKWQKIKEKKIGLSPYRKYITKTFKMPDGRIANFDIKDEGRVICVLAITQDNKFVLVKEYRPGPEKILIELPGGGCNKNEQPIKAIKREFLEETGYTGKFTLLQKNYQCAYSSRIKYSFVATNCRKIQEQQLEENEFTEVILINLAKLKKHIKTGNLTDTDTAMLGLKYLKLL